MLHMRRFISIGIAVQLAVLAGVLAGCTSPTVPTPVPTYTPWVQIVTATPTHTAIPTSGPSPTFTPMPAPPTVTPLPPSPLPTRTPPPPPQAPVVQVIAPANGTQYTLGQVVSVQFTAASNAGVARAGLYVNGTQMSYHSYNQHPTLIRNDTLLWTPTAPGNYTLQIIGYDPYNNPGYSDQRTITVQQQAAPPTVRIDYPGSPTDIYVNQTLQLQATVNGALGIQRLELVVRKGSQDTVYTSDGNYHNVPYQWRVSWQSAQVGEHKLFVRTRDTNGQVGQSGEVTIRVIDNQPPQVQVTYSATTLGQGSDLKAHIEAVDSSGVTKINLRMNDKVVDKWEAPNPAVGQTYVSVDLWWRGVGPAGNYNVQVRAHDTLDNRVDTPMQVIHVQSGPPAPPNVVAKWEGGQFSLRITEQKDTGKIKGTLRSEGGTREAIKQSQIDGRNVTVHATIDGITYNLMLTLSTDGNRLEGNWSTTQTGVLVPITLVKTKDL
ncbi:MAG: hypothetical protein KKA73_26185 [Chloroflexi bacterium]|nr:hypothetical protein [Chloroflexota bacterium]MBU1751189.1 hypothetical protein [Chloroflexota bacterium]